MDIHPYYLARTKTIMRDMRFDEDADPGELAAWAQSADGRRVALATSDGHIVGHGTNYPRAHAAYADDETIDRYGLRPINEIGFAVAQIERAIGRPVVIVRASRFAGARAR